MQKFPIDKLKPLPGYLWGPEDRLCITVPLQPFSLVIEEDGDEITFETSLRLDGVKLSSDCFGVLAGRTFTFPVNPKDGYIDGSIYIDHAHHAVDITAIRFGSLVGNAIEIELEGDLNFEFEGLGNFANTHWVCQTYMSRSNAAVTSIFTASKSASILLFNMRNLWVGNFELNEALVHLLGPGMVGCSSPVRF